MTLSMQALRATPILLSLISVAYISRLLADNSLFKTGNKVIDAPDVNDGDVASKCPEEESSGGAEEDREKNRGMLVSLISAFLINIVGSLMARKGVPDGYIVLNYGFILAPVIGYLLDVGIATEVGLRKTKRGGLGGAVHAMGSLASPTFFRYVITVFLDMFISNPIQDAMKVYFMDAKNTIPNNFLGYGQTVRRNFASLLQSVVGVATFQAYTNDTRFRWAYTDGDKKGRVANDVIMIATAIGASLFMAYTIPGAESLGRRVPFAMMAILLLSIGNSVKWNRCGKEPVSLFDASDEDVGLDDTTRAIIGTAMFAMFVFVGLVVPFSRAKERIF